MTVILFRVRMRANVAPVNDGWSDRMVPARERFGCSPRRAAELHSIRAADLVTFDPDDVAAIAAFTADPLRTVFELALGMGLRPG